MSENELILQALNSLSARLETLSANIDGRFDKVDIRFDRLSTRVRRTENALTKVKAVTGAISAFALFFGWDHIKLWLVALKP